MTLARAALVLLASAAVLVALVRLLEPRLAFFPFPGETTTPRDLGLAYEPLTIETSDGERLRAWRIPHHQPGVLVVYFHGNGGNLSNSTTAATASARAGRPR